MRLQELFETTEEDRALISLASAIYDYAKSHVEDSPDSDLGHDSEDDEYFDFNDETHDEETDLGTIGQLFDTPIPTLNSIHIILQSDYGLRLRLKHDENSHVVTDPDKKATLAMWYPDKKAIILNRDFITFTRFRKVITHELRHALDDYKSDFKANIDNTKYTTPKKKEHQTTHHKLGNTAYLAQPAEINARFLEVMDTMVNRIKKASFLPNDQIMPQILRDFETLMKRENISDLFPEKEQSKDYKRLMKRGIDFIQKELAYVNSRSK